MHDVTFRKFMLLTEWLVILGAKPTLSNAARRCCVAPNQALRGDKLLASTGFYAA
jgi:hypothetical protein